MALLSFALHFGLALDFERIGALKQRDWLFDADPASRLDAFSQYVHLGIKHPNLMPYFSPAVGLAAKVTVKVGPAGLREPEVRRRLGTMVVPVASALQTAAVFLLFCRLGAALVTAVIATVLAQASFGSLIFGTIPESYGLTALALALSYLYAAGAGRGRGAAALAGWLALGVFATGITITSLVYAPIFVFAISLDRDRTVLPAAARAVAMATAVLAVTGGSAWVLDRLLVPPPEVSEAAPPPTLMERIARPGSHELITFASDDPSSKLIHFPTAIANTVAPSSVVWLSTPRPPRDPGFTLESTASIFGVHDPLGTSIVLLMLAGTFAALVDLRTRPTALASLLILAAGAGLSVWGTEAFLYSQSWQLAVIVLIAAVMRPGRAASWMTAALAALTLAVAVSNVAALNGMFSTLEAMPR